VVRSGLDLFGREPVGHLDRQRRPEAGDGRVGIDIDTGLGRQHTEGGRDARPAVDQRQIQVEADEGLFPHVSERKPPRREPVDRPKIHTTARR
jgi:hypothetical protein